MVEELNRNYWKRFIGIDGRTSPERVEGLDRDTHDLILRHNIPADSAALTAISRASTNSYFMIKPPLA